MDLTSPGRASRRHKLAAAGAGVFLGVVVAVLAFGGDSTDTSPWRASEFVLFGGETSSFEEFDTPMVINFWASWCPPCVRELPELEAAHQAFGDEVTFVGLANKDDRSKARELAESSGLTYALGEDRDAEVFRSFGLFAMPSTVLIASDGTVAEVIAGPIDASELGEKLEGLLAQR